MDIQQAIDHAVRVIQTTLIGGGIFVALAVVLILYFTNRRPT